MAHTCQVGTAHQLSDKIMSRSGSSVSDLCHIMHRSSNRQLQACKVVLSNTFSWQFWCPSNMTKAVSIPLGLQALQEEDIPIREEAGLHGMPGHARLLNAGPDVHPTTLIILNIQFHGACQLYATLVASWYCGNNKSSPSACQNCLQQF